MAIIARDLMVGNPRLAELGFGEEALGHNAILGGFQGQRQWTDHFPNGDFMEAMLNSSFDWNGIREPFVFATENDCLNGVCDALRPPADGHGADLRRRAHLLEPGRGEARHRPRARPARAAGGIIHLINSGAATLDGTGRQTRERHSRP